MHRNLATHKKREVKAMPMLLDSVKDHLIPHISEKKTAKDMYDALVGLYQSGNTSRKLTLRHQLQSVEMSSSDTVASYIMRITQIRDQLVAIGEAVDDRVGECGIEWFSQVLGTICAGDLCKREVVTI